jgi:hypothetical protein
MGMAALLAAPTWAQNPSDISLTLAARDHKSTFRVGEAVELELRFQSSVPGKYQVWSGYPNRYTRQAEYDRFSSIPLWAASTRCRISSRNPAR